MRQHTTKGDGCTDECVELLVAADGELKVARSDALDVEVLGSVAGQFEYLCGQILEHGGEVDGRLGADAGLVAGDVTEMAFHPAAGELQAGLCAVRLGRLRAGAIGLTTGLASGFTWEMF